MTALRRHRYGLLSLLTAAVAAWFAAWLYCGGEQGDVPLESLGWHILNLHLYAEHPLLQIGPAPLSVMGLALHAGRPDGQVLLVTITLALVPLGARALERTALALGYTAERAAVMALCAGAALLIAFAQVARISHLEDAIAVTVVLWAVAAIAERRAWWVPSLLLGGAASCKPWAIVAVPVLLHLDRNRLKAFGVAAVAAALPWSPYVLADPHTITSLTLVNFVWPYSVLRVFGFAFGQTAPHGARAMEMIVGTLFGTLAALRGKWLAVPLVAFAGRLLIEPTWFIYYGALAVAGALLWDLGQDRRVPLWTLWTLTLEFGLQSQLPWDSTTGAYVNALFAFSVIGGVLLAPATRLTTVRPFDRCRPARFAPVARRGAPYG